MKLEILFQIRHKSFRFFYTLRWRCCHCRSTVSKKIAVLGNAMTVATLIFFFSLIQGQSVFCCCSLFTLEESLGQIFRSSLCTWSFSNPDIGQKYCHRNLLTACVCLCAYVSWWELHYMASHCLQGCNARLSFFLCWINWPVAVLAASIGLNESKILLQSSARSFQAEQTLQRIFSVPSHW